MRRVLIVEDDPRIGESLLQHLKSENYFGVLCPTLKTGRTAFREELFDLVLLDINLPDGLGYDLCREIKDNDPQLPIIFLTAKLDEDSAIKGLSLGAVDYIRKPFSHKELMLRIRRTLKEIPETLQSGNLLLDTKKASVTWKGNKIHLTPRENEILSLLLQNKARVLTRDNILSHIDSEGCLDDKTINTYVKRLKEKLSNAGVTSINISAVYGSGYRLESE